MSDKTRELLGEVEFDYIPAPDLDKVDIIWKKPEWENGANLSWLVHAKNKKVQVVNEPI